MFFRSTFKGKKGLFYELFTERYFGNPKMVLLWHHCKNPPFRSFIL